MLDLVTDETRLLVISARSLAFAGKLPNALERLDEHCVMGSLQEVDLVAIFLTKAELLYLNGEYLAAYSVFKTHLDPLLSSIEHSIALVVSLNRIEIAWKLHDPEEGGKFYDLIDEQYIAGITHVNDSAMLHASKSAAEGKSYDSLPVIWQELVRTFRQGRWLVFRDASRWMAEECVRVGEIPEAAFHAVMARDEKLVEKIAETILSLRNIPTVDATINKLLATANLNAHFNVACKLIQGLSDAIPDSLIDPVIRWILPHCTNKEEPEDHAVTEIAAWKTIEQLAPRSSADSAKEILLTVIGHRSWVKVVDHPDQYIRVRAEIINAVDEIVEVLPVDSLEGLVDEAIPIAAIRRNSYDFRNILDLLGRIVFRLPSVRDKIREALYPKGEPLPPILMQLASHFGQELTNKDNQLEIYAETVAKNIENVVQHVPSGQEAVGVDGNLMTYTITRENEQLQVALINGVAIHAITRNHEKFSQNSIRRLLVAMQKSIIDPHNLHENRIVFINCIKAFASCLNERMAGDIFDVLGPIAEGKFEISSEIPQGQGQFHSLSRMRFNGTTKEEVSSLALFCLACIEKELPEVYGDRLQSIVEISLCSDSPEIRKSAFAAVREIPTIRESTWMPLILGTRDPDENAAALAYGAISTKKEASLPRPQWRMLVYSLNIAQLYDSIKLRRAAAKVVTTLAPQAPTKKLREELEAIRQVFASDIAFSVRNAISNSSD